MDPREWRQQFQISPVGINEAVLVDLEMICNCECEVAGNPGYEENSESCGGVGSYKCGVCECPEDYFGRYCECSATNLSFQGEGEADDLRPTPGRRQCGRDQAQDGKTASASQLGAAETESSQRGRVAEEGGPAQ